MLSRHEGKSKVRGVNAIGIDSDTFHITHCWPKNIDFCSYNRGVYAALRLLCSINSLVQLVSRFQDASNEHVLLLSCQPAALRVSSVV